mgnify:CR=1 FL=1
MNCLIGIVSCVKTISSPSRTRGWLPIFWKSAINAGWSLNSRPNIIDFLAYFWNCGIQHLPPEVVRGLIEIVRELNRRKWSPKDFVGYVTRHYNQLIAYPQYLRGEISYEEFMRRTEPYVKA